MDGCGEIGDYLQNRKDFFIVIYLKFLYII